VKSLSSVNAKVVYLDQTSTELPMTVTPSAPGIFTADSSGAGQGAIFDGTNYSLIGPGNPAARDSVVTLYITGEGETVPSGITGKVTVLQSAPPYTPGTSLVMAVTVDGQPATVEWQGEAPGYVSGIMQVNVRIPQASRTGNVPIVVTVGSRSSQNGTVFITVQ
jgi:uncharacterized protein (TIGR03437 family)